MNLEEIVKKRLGKRSPRQVIGELIEINILDLPENDKGQSILEDTIITRIKTVRFYLAKNFLGEHFNPQYEHELFVSFGLDGFLYKSAIASCIWSISKADRLDPFHQNWNLELNDGSEDSIDCEIQIIK